jgi:hypothetical protein
MRLGDEAQKAGVSVKIKTKVASTKKKVSHVILLDFCTPQGCSVSRFFGGV